MQSHCSIKFNRHLEPNNIEQDINEIIHNRFNDILIVEAHIAPNEICDWNIKYDNTHNFNLCLKTNEIIELIHPLDIWDKWAQLIFEDELVAKYKAIISDEEYPQQVFEPFVKDHTTFIKYLENILSHHSLAWKQAIINIELANLPEALKNI